MADRDATEADPDATERELRTRASRREYLDRGTLVDRYVVLEKLGEGGMGVVYSAFDPELDRKIAIKLMPGDSSGFGDEQGWLMREAQSLARLSHPNVVSVHDVGTLPGARVFIAMELVDGVTLRKWLESGTRSWRQVLAIGIAAGTGLAAAHAAGLVHRDIKPDNIIVGKDGRVRVMDFGIARVQRSDARPTTEDAPTPASTVKNVIGTPAYLAPEVFEGQPADRLSDQFAFGVTLFEALFGARPYRGQDFNPQLESARPKIPSGSRVPARIQRAISRAISIDPAQRFSSLETMLGELAIERTGTRRVLIAVAITVAVVASIGVASAMRGDHAIERCGGAREKIAGVWDATVRGRVQQAFADTKRGHAATTFVRVAALIDDYENAWVALRIESCKATARGEQSDRLLDLRAACLQRHLKELAAMIELFARAPSPQIVDKSISGILSLPAVTQCRDDDALLASVAPPSDPVLRGRVDQLLEQLDDVAALSRAGDYVTASAQAEALVAATRALPYLPVRAKAFITLAEAYRDAGKYDEAEALYHDVTRIAGAVRDDADLAVGLIGLIEQSARSPSRMQEAVALAPVAEAVISRLSAPAPALADLELTLATGYQRAGKHEASLQHYELALQHAEVDASDQLRLASILTDVGALLETEGRHEEAREHNLRSLAILERTLGHDHPDVAAPLNNLANTALHQRRFDEAEDYQRRALTIMQRSLAPEHPEVAISLNNLGIVYQERGDYRAARELYQRALDMYLKLLGPDDPMVGVSYNNIGEVVLLAGKPDDALAFFQHAIATWNKSLPADHPMYAYALTGSGKCRLAGGKAVDAVKLLELAHKIRETSDEDPVLSAETDFALARALWETDSRSRAMSIAKTSLATYRSRGESATKDRAEVERWIDAHQR